jgi:tetratricopeptide (TPR) repeat protein
VWLYRSAEEKRRLVGAGRTSFSKPWLAEIHVHEQGVPHPILRHELVHALASAAAGGPLRVPARAGLLVNAGLVEGLAVALEGPTGSFGVHGLARAMRDQGRLPQLASLLGASGFFGAAPARAYVAAGSFLRFLLDRYGPAPVAAAYRSGDVARALGRPLADLDAEWQRFLDGVSISPALAAAAEARFEPPSLFARACAREVATLGGEAARASASGHPAEAEALLRRSSALSGGDPTPLRPAAEAWHAAGDTSRAQAILEEALASARARGGRHALQAALLGSLGDLRLRRGDGAGAVDRYRAALALGPVGAEARSLRARLAAASDVGLRAEVAPWLLGAGDPALALSRLAQSDTALARYLLARARLARGAPSRALADLEALDVRALPDPAFVEEAQRMAAEASCLAGRWDAGIAAWKALAARATEDGARDQAEDAARRCAFERDSYGEPVTWDGDWP